MLRFFVLLLCCQAFAQTLAPKEPLAVDISSTGEAAVVMDNTVNGIIVHELTFFDSAGIKKWTKKITVAPSTKVKIISGQRVIVHTRDKSAQSQVNKVVVFNSAGQIWQAPGTYYYFNQSVSSTGFLVQGYVKGVHAVRAYRLSDYTVLAETRLSSAVEGGEDTRLSSFAKDGSAILVAEGTIDSGLQPLILRKIGAPTQTTIDLSANPPLQVEALTHRAFLMVSSDGALRKWVDGVITLEIQPKNFPFQQFWINDQFEVLTKRAHGVYDLMDRDGALLWRFDPREDNLQTNLIAQLLPTTVSANLSKSRPVLSGIRIGFMGNDIEISSARENRTLLIQDVQNIENSLLVGQRSGLNRTPWSTSPWRIVMDGSNLVRQRVNYAAY